MSPEPLDKNPSTPEYAATIRASAPVDPSATLRAPSLPADAVPTAASAATLPGEVAAAPPAARFGKYVRAEKLGSGAMGEVWRAWDEVLRRWVAVKFLKGGDDAQIARFMREAQTAGGLSHPNIAQIFEAGMAEGRHFIAMQFVEGRTLRSWIGKDARVVAEMIRDAARAVAYANAQGIVHRDLKPDNLMALWGRSQPHVFVMDFGLARPVEEGSQVSLPGGVVGTPAYMPPEQAKGLAVDARADVYGLGATLYELLCGRAPFVGANTYETLKMIAEEDVLRPRKIDRRIDRELETIALKCLEKDAGRRYAGAGELAEDLTRWLKGLPIQAHPPSVWYRARKMVARRKGLAAVGALGLAGVVAATAVFVPMVARERAEKAEARAVQELWGRIAGLMSDAEMYARHGDMEQARRRLDSGIRICRGHLELHDSPHARWFLGRLLRRRGQPEEALKELDAALARRPDLGEARFERGLLLIERYALALIERQQDAIAAGEAIPRAADLEARHPEVAELRRRAIEDLSHPFGETAWFRPVEARFGRAELARIRGDLSSAKELAAVVAEEPMYVEALLSLARIEADARRYDAALAFASDAVDRHRGWADAHLTRADIAMQKARALGQRGSDAAAAKLAEESAGRAIDLGLRSVLAFQTRGLARHFLGRQDDAVADFEAAVALRETYSLRNNLAAANYDRGRDDEALRHVERSLELNPRFPNAWYNKGLLLDRKGDLDGADAAWARCLEIDPSFMSAWGSRMRVLFAKGQGEEALKRCDELIASGRAPGHGEWQRAKIWESRKEWKKAEADFTACAAAQPGNPIPLYDRGAARIQLKDLEGALADYTAVIERNPDFETVYWNRAVVHWNRQDFAACAADAAQWVKRAPKDAKAAWLLALASRQAGDLPGARAAYDHLLTLEPLYIDRWIERGHVRYAQGDTPGALADYEHALTINPDHPFARLARGGHRLASARYTEAAADFLAAAEASDPGRRSAAHLLRWCARARSGQKDAASADLRRSLPALADWPPAALAARFFLGDIDESAFLKDCDALGSAEESSKARYFAAWARLVAGDVDGAVPLLREARKLPIDWIERRSADLELLRLGKD